MNDTELAWLLCWPQAEKLDSCEDGICSLSLEGVASRLWLGLWDSGRSLLLAGPCRAGPPAYLSHQKTLAPRPHTLHPPSLHPLYDVLGYQLRSTAICHCDPQQNHVYVGNHNVFCPIRCGTFHQIVGERMYSTGTGWICQRCLMQHPQQWKCHTD